MNFDILSYNFYKIKSVFLTTRLWPFDAVFTMSRLSFTGSNLLEQLDVASLSHPTLFL